jgi:hypothetical protein
MYFFWINIVIRIFHQWNHLTFIILKWIDITMIIMIIMTISCTSYPHTKNYEKWCIKCRSNIIDILPIYKCMYIYTYLYIYIYVYIYIYIHTYIYVHIYMYMYVYIYKSFTVYLRGGPLSVLEPSFLLCIFLCVYIYVYLYIYLGGEPLSASAGYRTLCICMHIYIYICIDT